MYDTRRRNVISNIPNLLRYFKSFFLTERGYQFKIFNKKRQLVPSFLQRFSKLVKGSPFVITSASMFVVGQFSTWIVFFSTRPLMYFIGISHRYALCRSFCQDFSKGQFHLDYPHRVSSSVGRIPNHWEMISAT